MRGIRWSGRQRRLRLGISPAHAGNTPVPSRGREAREDQPRTCGEYRRACRSGTKLGGSAPHMRGIQTTRCGEVPQRRISPAHAGNTSGAAGVPWQHRDQPRTCGEYKLPAAGPPRSGGSAPHMRGIPRGVGHIGVARGISPAHAGNTPTADSDGWSRQDQPRTCGEYAAAIRATGCTLGSAPHMRGIHRGPCRVGSAVGISPAHAGNTQFDSAAVAGRGDQPRTCGEYELLDARYDLVGGSAPHMRGIPRRKPQPPPRRISPAHAGNTSSRSPIGWLHPDQPRTCGEYGVDTRPAGAIYGSAPHMRGIH